MRDQLAFFAYAVLIIGVLILIASLFADPLALGQPGTGFGWKQMLGTVIGAAITFGGYRLVRRVERGR
ncbi:MAG TPA: hypothetical protein PKA95_17720 [Thermomicrobiales bacterium]|nr:hypothetical protein [Thermomicrobiales bacterium]